MVPKPGQPGVSPAGALRFALLPLALALLALFFFRHVNDRFVAEDRSFSLDETAGPADQPVRLSVAARPGESFLVTVTGIRGRTSFVRRTAGAALELEVPYAEKARSIRIRNFAGRSSTFPVTYVLFDDSPSLHGGAPPGALARLLLIAAALVLLHALSLFGLWLGLAGRSLRVGLEREAAFPLVAAVIPGLLLLASQLGPYHVVWGPETFLLYLGITLVFVKVWQVVRHRGEGRVGAAISWLGERAEARGRLLQLWITLAFLVVLIFPALARHDAYHSGAADLGLFDQVTRSTLHGDAGRTAMKHESFFEEHTAFIFYLIAPIYAVYDDPRMLLLLQSFFLAAATVPLYLIAEELLGSRVLGIALSALYMLSPFVWRAHLVDFHQETLVPFFFLASFHAALRGRWTLYAACAALALLCKEDMALYLVGWGLLMAFTRERSRRRAGLLTAAAGTAWFLLCMLVFLPAYSSRPDHLTLAARYGYLGDTLGAVVRTLITHPGVLAKHLFTTENLGTVADLLLSAAFLPLFSLRALLLLAAPLFVNVLSELHVQKTLGLHYAMPALPFLFFGAVLGLRRVLASHAFIRSGVNPRLFACGIMLFAAANWLSAVSPLLTRETFAKEPRYTVADDIIAALPRGHSVSAQNSLLPHIFRTSEAYLFPDIASADYVLLDQRGVTWPLDGPGYAVALERLRRDRAYTLLRDEAGFLFFGKRAASPARVLSGGGTARQPGPAPGVPVPADPP